MANSFCAQLYLTPCDPIDSSPLAPLSLEFSTQEYWTKFLFPAPGGLYDPGIEPESLTCHALAGRFFTTSATWDIIQKHNVNDKRILYDDA